MDDHGPNVSVGSFAPNVSLTDF